MSFENSIIKRSKSSPKGNKNNRKSIIIEALKQCILRKGYADTRLTDIAKEANLSLSHLNYYYSRKDEVLLDLAIDHHQGVHDRVDEHKDKNPKERINILVEEMFAGASRDELALLREFIGLAPHKRELQELLERHAKIIFSQFVDIFKKAPRAPALSATDVAELAGSLWIGLMLQASVRKDLDENEARRLFHTTLLLFADFD